MYLRIRKLDKESLETGKHVLMIAEQLSKVGAIAMKPGVLEWWDGVSWNEVKVVDQDASSRSPYE